MNKNTPSRTSVRKKIACLLAVVLSSALGTVQAQSSPPLGEAANFGLLSGSSIQAANYLPVSGKVGASQTIPTTVTATNGVLANGAIPVPAALADAQTARTWCSNLSGQTSLTGLAGQSLPAGIYKTTSSITIGQGQALTLTGDSSSVYVFNINGSLTLKQNAHLNLGDVQPNHVFWHVKGDFSAGVYASWNGVVLTDGPSTFAGDFYGRMALLSGGTVQLNSRDIASGMLAFTAPALLRPDPSTNTFTCGPTAITCAFGGAVNLVSNGSFEVGNCTGSADFDGYPNQLVSRVGCWLGWGSPDWFTTQVSCNYGGRTPDNQFNQAFPVWAQVNTPTRTGIAYAGIYAKDVAITPTGTNADEREYVIQVLPQALQAGQAYYVEYFASLAPTSQFTLGHLQVAFMNALPPKTKGQGQNAASVITSTTATIVASTGNLPATQGPGWTRVGGAFKPANGSNLNVMLLGNFLHNDVGGIGPDNSSLNGNRYPGLNHLDGAYYYIEDVSLIAFPTAGPATVPVACGNRTVQLGTCPLPATAGATYQWSPAAGLNNPQSPNPVATITGYSPVTYTLTVSAGGQSSTTTTTIVPPAPQSCPCTQLAYGLGVQNTYQAPAGNQAWELGQANYQPTGTPARPYPINANGGTVVFDGVYHILSSVELLNGTFEVRPGTVFYTDGGQVSRTAGSNIFSGCYLNGVLDRFIQLWVGDKTTLRATGATFTSTCAGQWGGIELYENSTLELSADPASGQRCVVSQARVGVQLGTPCSSFDANCLITGTDFVNDWYGVTSLGFPDHRDARYNGITGCSFTSNLSTMLPPYNGGSAAYTHAGLVLHGQWHDGIEYRDNSFESVYVGVEVAGGYNAMSVNNNTFSNNYGAAIQVVGGSYGGTVTNPNVPTRIGDLLLNDNKIEVPGNPTPGGQVPTNSPVYGIQVLPLPLGGNALSIEANHIFNPNAPGNPTKPMVGLDMQFSFDYHYVQRQNQFENLDEGVRLMDAGGANTKEEYVTDNLFRRNVTAVVISGQQYAPFAPAISCNTMQEGNVGIMVENNATVGQLSGPQGGPGPFGFEPVANKYIGLGVDVQDDGAYPLTYLGLDVMNENPNYSSGSGVPISVMPTPGTPCDSRPTYGPGVNGLFRPAAGGGPNWQGWEDAIRQPDGGATQLHNLTLRLIDYRERNGQLAQLETYANTLPLLNDAAFERISLYLMERYRHLGQASDAQRVRRNLLANRGHDAEMQQRVQFFDVESHLLGLAPGAVPTLTDSTALSIVAGSSSGFAPVACAILRHYYPQSTCGTALGIAGVSPRSAAVPSSITRSAVQLQAYPNPIHDQFSIRAVGLHEAATQFQLVEMSTGRAVLTQAVAGEQLPTIAVGKLAPGVYVGRLLGQAGRLLGTCKVVVIH